MLYSSVKTHHFPGLITQELHYTLQVKQLPYLLVKIVNHLTIRKSIISVNAPTCIRHIWQV